MSNSSVNTGKLIENLDAQARQILIDLLKEAAQLEHCLLNAYLYTACSLQSMPSEFAELDGQPNRRRAVQYERARGWKQSMLLVAHEEMRHLHYVQCMLRGLGESPNFILPKRNEQTGEWIFPNWKARAGKKEDNDGLGMSISISPFSLNTIKRFVLYESTDALQDNDPFGAKVTELFDKLYHLEVDLRLEGMLLEVDDDKRRQVLKEELYNSYTTLTPLPEELESITKFKTEVVQDLPSADQLRFQSIADLYLKGISPLYEQAFDRGWVVNNNRDLVNELLNPNYAAEGFLPIGPIYRAKNFQQSSQKLDEQPLANYKQVSDIIAEIVEEGEGATYFEQQAQYLIETIANMGGRAYWKAWLADKRSQSTPTPNFLEACEKLRQSHLYRFAMVLSELRQEQKLCEQVGQTFNATRPSLPVTGSIRLSKMADELPNQFNACYLVMLAWLSRMYEIKDWLNDQPRRQTIEMIASWPMMSLTIRPFLELASFLPVDRSHLFWIDEEGLPQLPLEALQLLQLYNQNERNQTINDEMDYLGLRVLASVARWANIQIDAVKEADWPIMEKEMVLTRLQGLACLDEFSKQFPYRVHGGYSDRIPDLSFLQQYPDGNLFEEDPSTIVPLFKDTLLLRVRFAGQGLVQLSTDPDPPTDETGCTGTHMIHAADGDRRFNRALIWQKQDSKTVIQRDPIDHLPPLGVNAVDISLMVTTPDGAKAGYIPLQMMQSLGAVQANGVQQLTQINGLTELITLKVEEILGNGQKIQLDLFTKNGQKPFLNGDNHLVWKDGEPIDPFILGLLIDDPNCELTPELIVSREVYNNNLSMREFSPLQRAMSARGPVGFQQAKANIPQWALNAIAPQFKLSLSAPGYPMTYLNNRAKVLIEAIEKEIQNGPIETQERVDNIISYAERLKLVTLPRNTSVAWLTILLHYGHTISGSMQTGLGLNKLLLALKEASTLPLNIRKDFEIPSVLARSEANNRWLIRYTMGTMDTDALTNTIYGELYIPLNLELNEEPISLTYSWKFPNSLRSALLPITTRFNSVFWTTANLNGKTRYWDSFNKITVTDTLINQYDTGYTYTSYGVTDVINMNGEIQINQLDQELLELSWKLSFTYSSIHGAINTCMLFSQTQQQMIDSLRQYLIAN